MIMPNMATMIAVITTDAPVQPAALHEILLSQVRVTFNKVTVDSDSSTNDTCVIFASGDAAQGVALIEQGRRPTPSCAKRSMPCARTLPVQSPRTARVPRSS